MSAPISESALSASPVRRLPRLPVGGLLVTAALALGAWAAVLATGDRVRHLALPVLGDPSLPKAAAGAAIEPLPSCELSPAAALPGRVGALLEASDGTLWLGGFDTGLYRRPPGGAPGSAVAVQGFAGRERFVNALAEHRGHLWVATYGGVVELDPRGLRVRTHLRGVAAEALVLRDGLLLAGTIHGLYRLGDAGTFEDTGTKGPDGEGIRVTALALSGDTLWIGSPNGAYSLPVRTLRQVSAPVARWHPLVFGEEPADTNVVLSLAPLGDGVVAGTDNGGLVRLDAKGGVKALRFQEARANEANPGAFASADGTAFFGTQG
ncbi:MAG TPA: hypothetical protein VK447_16450, partial [Myxococcaceae bacterium]|nr:hypothetical protein [Myxococcaceae bacterium]